MISTGVVAGSSMSPTFNPGSSKSKDVVLLWKLGVKDPQNLNLNDVVFLKSPISPDQLYIKRIKAVQGDKILARYPWGSGNGGKFSNVGGMNGSTNSNQVLIPRGHIWVEGDNVHSIDSNTYGSVSSGMVVGKAVWRIWPPQRWGPIESTGGRECRVKHLQYSL